jgi:transposase-like protein
MARHGISTMTLSPVLNDTTFTLACPHCGHSFDKKGSWVKVVRHYTCDKCRTRVLMRYDTKVAIFSGLHRQGRPRTAA